MNLFLDKIQDLKKSEVSTAVMTQEDQLKMY